MKQKQLNKYQKKQEATISHKSFTLLSVLSVLFLISCQSVLPSSTSFTRSGTEGIIVKFLADAPPAQAYPESQFTIGMEFENRGTADVSRPLYLLSVDEEFIQTLNQPKSLSRLRGRNIYNTRGDVAIRSVDAITLPLAAQSQNQQASVRVTLCYPYKTEAFATVCVDSDPLGLRKGIKACTPGVQGLSASQGAPVAVRQVQASMIPNEDGVLPQFVITVANVGTGQVFAQQRVTEACSSKPIKSEELNVVQLHAFLGEQELMCEPSLLHLGQESTTRCQAADVLQNTGAFTSPLRITLDYGYTSTINKEIHIKR